ncbi:MAG: peptide chain release factor N(5)-glutamine methyltransferase [Pelomonas sp.]|nr:peptide chain release factor N(5)-glutamine methyltransferase [Roseateles sp.]
MTIAEALTLARQQGLDALDAQLLLCHLLGVERTWLIGHDDQALTGGQVLMFEAVRRRRADGEPLAYIVGHKEFHGLALRVTRDTLVPRPDTEVIVDWALELLERRPTARVVDLGTGSGAIALAVKHAAPGARVEAVERSAAALAVARDNAVRLGLEVGWHAGDWFAPLAAQRYELVLSNPPYIADGDPHLPALTYEPDSALTAGPDGLRDLRAIIAATPEHLTPGGWLLLEHGYDQAEAVAGLLRERGFASVRLRLDLGGQARVTGGCWRPPAQ